MNQAISPGLVPPPTGLEREEPEIADELDIPSEDSHDGTGPPYAEGAKVTQKTQKEIQKEI